MSYIDLWDEDDPEYQEALDRQNKRKDAIEVLRQEIITYADKDSEHGWLVIRHEGKQHKFTKRALIHNVFEKMAPLQDLLPEYTPFSPPGLKLQMDDRYHSDVWLGAGFDLDDVYDDSDDKDAYYEAIIAIEDEFHKITEFDFTILANGMDMDHIRCAVFEFDPPLKKDSWSNTHVDSADKPNTDFDDRRCIVIPHAGIEYDLPARNADVIITEQGGKLSHLSTVSREKGKLLIRMDNAIERFPIFSRFTIDLEKLTLVVR